MLSCHHSMLTWKTIRCENADSAFHFFNSLSEILKGHQVNVNNSLMPVQNLSLSVLANECDSLNDQLSKF